MIRLPHASDSPTWLGALGLIVPVVIALLVWGVALERRVALLEQGEKMLLALIKEQR